MEKIKFKFVLSIIFLINTTIIVFFFNDIALDIEYIFLPVFFIYFFIDSLTVIIPYMNDAVFSGKQFQKFLKAILGYNKEKLKQLKDKNNRIALAIFIIYFSILTIIGILYLNIEAFTRFHIYVLFFLLNTADYTCILIWCPFRSIFLKNKCCTTCRISNWDRIMKFYILFFVFNPYTIGLGIIGVVVFLIWEYFHYTNPERFYHISNYSLSCKECTQNFCKNKNKEYP